VKPDVNPLIEIARSLLVHLARHANRRAHVIVGINQGRVVINPGGRAPPQAALNPITGAFMLPRVARDAAPAGDRAHAIAEANRIGDHRAPDAWTRRQVADHHRAAGRVGARREIISAQVHPSPAHQVMRHAHLRFAARMPHPVKLAGAIGRMPDPGVHRVKPGNRDVRHIRRRRRFRRGNRGEAIRHVPGIAIIIGKDAVRPGTLESHLRVNIVQNHLVGLIANRAHRHHRRPRIEAVVGKHAHLIHVPVVLHHLPVHPAPRRPTRPIPRQPMPAAGKHNPARQCPCGLRPGRRNRPQQSLGHATLARQSALHRHIIRCRAPHRFGMRRFRQIPPFLGGRG